MQAFIKSLLFTIASFFVLADSALIPPIQPGAVSSLGNTKRQYIPAEPIFVDAAASGKTDILENPEQTYMTDDTANENIIPTTFITIIPFDVTPTLYFQP